ncbi:hypothetical protein FHS13_002444 [Nocardiopsis algeriensis]|uniref:Uncharacterized protein n=1 Tax=Nocardiopsis algeriensis TaxID=1478215 RepID=A0A841IQU8_9ACTN|nr:hypothetical protein [Nocardiopsis algeriensis]
MRPKAEENPGPEDVLVGGKALPGACGHVLADVRR